MKLNEKIIYYRKKTGMSQIDLADVMGVSRQTISKWETAESNPEINKLPALAKALNVSIDWLLSEEDIVEETETETEESSQTIHIDSQQYPEWIEHLPKFALGMVKKYGWLYGAYTAAGGAFFALFGVFARVLSHNFIFGRNSNLLEPFSYGSYYDPFAEINQQAWTGFSAITGLAIAIGVGIMIYGIVIAIALKNWGDKQ